MAVNAISPKYFPLVMSASTWSLPTGSRSTGQERGSLRFHAFLGGKNRGEFEEWAARVHPLYYALSVILLICDARSGHVQEVQCCPDGSFSDDGCTFGK